MPWPRFRGKRNDPAAAFDQPRGETPPPGMPASARPVRRASDSPEASRLAQLRQRRALVDFDLEQAEAATRPDNPWQERIVLLGESLASVDRDLAALGALPVEPPLPLPPTPITDIAASVAEPASVRFTIGNERFLFEEETDWDQRGGPRIEGDLQQRTGNAEALIPATIPPERRPALARHLTDSVIVFAVDLRDRALNSEPLPESASLADLSQPCPECGGWRDWRGTCEVCAQRNWQGQQLRAERSRLEAERLQEEQDRHKWAERLPIARRRVADIDAEIAKLGDAP